MIENYADEFRQDLVEFRKNTRDFYDKKITVNEYKGLSGGFGSYAQRGGDLGMLRLRLCGGRITKEYLDFIVESIDKHHINLIHFTTCQSVQLHNLSADTICTLVEEAWDNGIMTRGGGGDYPRNVMVSPLSGVECGEFFDMTPYANAAADYMLGFIKKSKLPRKLKVCFSNSPKNYPHATFRDLGFVAGEDHTFDVYSAGGLGNNPKIGICVASKVASEKILYYIKAMIDTFISYGNYENRGKARTRYMQDTLGTQGYKDAYLEKLENVMKTEQLDLHITPMEFSKSGSGTISHSRVVAQKQLGLYAVSYHPIGGNPSIDTLHKLRDALHQMQDVELRLTPREGMYIINCTAKEAEKILDITKDGSETLFESSVACIGNTICQVGARDSQKLLKNCVAAVKPHNFADGVLPRIHISGCPSSCGTHQIAALGFRGAVKQTEDGPKPAFAMFEDGSHTQGTERFGKELGVMLEEDIPNFFITLGQFVSKEDTSFEYWKDTHYDTFLDIVKAYTK